MPNSASDYSVIGRGKFGGNQVDFLDGTIDQVHLHDRASAGEIEQPCDSGA